jgi:hypothetical protein
MITRPKPWVRHYAKLNTTGCNTYLQVQVSELESSLQTKDAGVMPASSRLRSPIDMHRCAKVPLVVKPAAHTAWQLLP